MAIVRRPGEFRAFFQELARRVQSVALTEAFNFQYLSRIGANARRRIQTRTRDGFGVRNGRQQRLRPLAGFTISKRRFLRSLGLLNPTTSSATSNLTERGTLLESIVYRVNARQRSIRLFFNSDEQDRKAAAVSGRRPFFFLTDDDIEDYTSQFEQRLASVIARRVRNL